MKNYGIKEGYIHKTNAQPKTAISKGKFYWNDYRLKVDKYYQHHVYKYAKNFIKSNKIQTVADVGCGTGWKLMHYIFPVCSNILGIDQLEVVKQHAQKYEQKFFEYDDFEIEEPRVKQKFDLIICSDVIEHLFNPDSLVNYIKKISNSGSYLILSTPERDLLHGVDNVMAKNGEHIREWNQSELENYISSFGFELIDKKIFPAQRFNFTLQYFRWLYAIKMKHHHCMMLVFRLK